MPVSCMGGSEVPPPVCHMPLTSAKALHVNTKYWNKVEGDESIGNSAVFGLTENFLNIVSHAVSTGT